MDDFIEQKKDLIDFINKEKNNNSINNSDLTKIYKLFFKTLSKTIIDIESKLSDIDNINIESCITNGINMVYYIFVSILSYTNNIKLTMFFSERALLLYTEFIIMSRNPILNDDLNFTPSINDALMFVYKKTIGPIIVSDIVCNKHMNILKLTVLNLKYIILAVRKYILLKKKSIKSEYNYLVDLVINFISQQLLIAHKIGDPNIIAEYIYTELKFFLDYNISNLINIIYVFKTFLELFDDLYYFTYNFSKTISVMNKFKIYLLNDDTVYSEFNENLLKCKKKTIFFKKFKKDLLSYI